MTKLKMPKGINASAPGQAFIAVMVAGDEGYATLVKGIRDLKANLQPAEFIGGACEALRDYFERNVDSWSAKVGDADTIKAGRRAAENRLQYWRNAFGRAAGGKFMRQKDAAGEFTSTFAFESTAAPAAPGTPEAAAADAAKKQRAPRQSKGAGVVTLAQFEALRAAAPDIALAFARMVLAEQGLADTAGAVKEADEAALQAAAIAQAEAEVAAAVERAKQLKVQAQAHAKALADANEAAKKLNKGK